MRKIIVSGCNGHMGRAVVSICSSDPEVEVIAGIDILGQPADGFPVYPSLSACPAQADAIIDFSHPAALDGLLAHCTQHTLPLVLATTGYSEQQLDQIERAAQVIPIFRSANMSFGMNVLLDLVRQAASLFGDDFDIEIIERHHNRKVDAPSGTALMLAAAAADALPYDPAYTYDRHQLRKAREHGEIGISSVRGGTIVGDHTVIFAGRDEVVEISHHAASREIFAAGAVKAAKFVSSIQQAGLFDMSMLIQSQYGTK